MTDSNTITQIYRFLIWPEYVIGANLRILGSLVD
jgi:hypothetical protein